ncbi:helix-turn-helix domain-containing protein [Larkinella punicea]|uniref:XRE family transcriptional regulator n=1 Tax=Larkinella punicea TaxID=2315727 RepID=A0A368JZ56_9BACT|nr:helix-turn-helix transcriptional regulator [Larkinella punicea]RCR71491.1 XRE family transcriptional regulator [Larkinella punicea]
MDKTVNSRRTLGEWMRQCREARQLPLRKVAAHLDVDTSIVAKMEKGQRHPNRIHLQRLAELFDEPFDDVLVLYLSDRVAYELASERCSDDVLRVAEEKIKYLRSKNVKQGELEF